jgi:hypothetical protein
VADDQQSGQFISLSRHALDSMAERGIRIEWVHHVVLNPQWTEPDRADPDLQHALGRIPEFGNRVLRVVYNHRARPLRVVTVFFDRSQRNRT